MSAFHQILKILILQHLPNEELVEFNYPNYKNYLAHEVINFFSFGFAILNLDDHEFSFYTQDNKEIYSAKLTEDFTLTAY